MFNQSSHYLLGNIFGMVMGFISFPILTRVFSVSEYGTLGLVSATSSILVAIMKFGSQYSTVRYFSQYKENGRSGLIEYYTTFIAQSILFALSISFIFLIISHFFHNLFNFNSQYFIFIIILLCISDSIWIRVTNFIRVEQKTKLYNSIGCFYGFAGLATGLFFLFYFSKSLISFYKGTILAHFLVLIIILLYYYWRKIDIKRFSMSLFKKSISYGFPLLLLELSSLFFKFIDRYLIEFKLGLNSVGMYTAGSNISQYIQEMIFVPITLAIFPIYMEIWNKEGKESVERFLSNTTNYMLVLCIPIIFGTSILSKELIIILASNKFALSYKIVPYIISGSIIWGFYNIFAAGLYIQKKTKVIATIIFLASCFNILLNLLLIPIWGIVGSAVSILISYIIMTCLIIKASFKYINIKINFLSIKNYILASIIMSFVMYNIKINNNLYSIILRFVAGIITYSIILILIDKNIRSLTNRLFIQTLKNTSP